MRKELFDILVALEKDRAQLSVQELAEQTNLKQDAMWLF